MWTGRFKVPVLKQARCLCKAASTLHQWVLRTAGSSNSGFFQQRVLLTVGWPEPQGGDSSLQISSSCLTAHKETVNGQVKEVLKPQSWGVHQKALQQAQIEGGAASVCAPFPHIPQVTSWRKTDTDVPLKRSQYPPSLVSASWRKGEIPLSNYLAATF